jgi:tellurite resistance protein
MASRSSLKRAPEVAVDVQWSPSADEAIFCVALLARDADGVVRPEETRLIVNRLSGERKRMGQDGELATVALLASSLRKDGLDRTLETLRHALGSPVAHRQAIRLAFEVALADRDLDPRESMRIAQMADLFGLDEAHLRAVLGD